MGGGGVVGGREEGWGGGGEGARPRLGPAVTRPLGQPIKRNCRKQLVKVEFKRRKKISL